MTIDDPMIAVLDIDGVVADVRHRLHHLAGRYKNWNGFFAAVADDPPLPTGVALAADLAERHRIVWLSGRPDWLRQVTETWLRSNGLPDGDVHLRRTNDRRPAAVFKLEALRRLERSGETIAAFVDDDEDVVCAARSAGYPAILADWIPRAAALRDAQDRHGRT